jgi:hypothetical protein
MSYSSIVMFNQGEIAERRRERAVADVGLEERAEER